MPSFSWVRLEVYLFFLLFFVSRVFEFLSYRFLLSILGDFRLSLTCASLSAFPLFVFLLFLSRVQVALSSSCLSFSFFQVLASTLFVVFSIYFVCCFSCIQVCWGMQSTFPFSFSFSFALPLPRLTEGRWCHVLSAFPSWLVAVCLLHCNTCLL